MANKQSIMDKLERNCKQLGIATSRPSAESVIAGGITITYVDAVIQSPMGGIDDSINPFLGIGVASPGKLSLDANPVSLEELQVFHIVSGMANNILLPSGEIQGSVDLLGMGE